MSIDRSKLSWEISQETWWKTVVAQARSYFTLEVASITNPWLQNFLRILAAYEIKTVSRNSSNHYVCGKTWELIKRKETVGEHITSSLKLADYYILHEVEFAGLDRLVVFDAILYHDDVEIPADDTSISDRKARETKELVEKQLIGGLAANYPERMGEKLLRIDHEYRTSKSPEILFAHAIDKMDALIHELKYPEDWGQAKKFDEANVRAWFWPAFAYSPTFTRDFEAIIEFLNHNGYFNS